VNTVSRGIDRLIGRIVSIAKWLALPLIVLLFLQWPLREFVRAYSREANDLGQVMFALFVAVSITAATRGRTHLAADLMARRYPPRTRRLLVRLGAAFGLLPWGVFVLIAARSNVLTSVRSLEFFQDSGNPGYFLIKIALVLMALIVILQALLDIIRPREPENP
jgi:TRAP-type mannitol/chloroaromatic compound transport system permease small subunit